MKKTYIQPTMDVVEVGVQLPLAASSETRTMDLFEDTVDGSSAMSSSFCGGDDGEDW